MQKPAGERARPARRCRGSLRDAENRLVYTLGVAEKLTKEKLLDFLARLGASARTPGACFITGGAERARGLPGPVSSRVGAAPFFWAGEKRPLTCILNSTRNPPGYLTRSPY